MYTYVSIPYNRGTLSRESCGSLMSYVLSEYQVIKYDQIKNKESKKSYLAKWEYSPL